MSKRKILIVDDSEHIKNLIAFVAEHMGFEVFFAENGEEAVLFFQTGEKADVVITDRRMPRMGGEELTRWIKSRYPLIKIIFSSSDHIKDFDSVARAAGADVVLHKTPASMVDDFSKALRTLAL